MAIDRFDGQYRFLSNFFHSIIEYEGEVYYSVEHAYQAAKTTDPKIRAMLQLGGSFGATAGEAKRFGKTIALRDDWEDVKLNVMRTLVYTKFEKHRDLAELLIKTAPHDLIEGNTWGDTFWGVCNGKGSNHLGKILMDCRINIMVMDSIIF